MPPDEIVIRGAREHNLKNIDVRIPRDRLVVITGLSGSGKSSLAFDTIYAEGQRRYVESLSAYARQFLGQMEKPDVDQIDGLSPAVSIDQKGASRNPRSTVGTVTEIYDHLRLLFARIGHPHCPKCGRPIETQTVQGIVDRILTFPENSKLLLLAPLIKDRKGEHQQLLATMKKSGYSRLRLDGQILELDDDIKIDKTKKHSIELVVDRIVLKPLHESGEQRQRLSDSVQTALKFGEGTLLVAVEGKEGKSEQLFSQLFACPACDISLPEIEPRTFSFNSPHGACPTCTGLGAKLEIDPELILDPELSLRAGAITPWQRKEHLEGDGYYAQIIGSFAKSLKISLDTPLKKLPAGVTEQLLYGVVKPLRVSYVNRYHRARTYDMKFEGVIAQMTHRYENSASDQAKEQLEAFMTERPCPACKGSRLKPEALSVTVVGKNILEVSQMTIASARTWLENSVADLSVRETLIAKQIIKELRARLGFLLNVGLEYLSLDRGATTLSGGEAQRIRLATQVGSGLMGVLYVLDEPSIGLHQRDNSRLIKTLVGLRDLGNTVIVVEHDEETIRTADWILDIGPRAGEHGGEVVAQGTLETILASERSLTAAYMTGRKQIALRKRRPVDKDHQLLIKGAREHNLRNLNVAIPLGVFVCVTGVSGSGKSTLITDILYRKLAKDLNKAKERPGKHDVIHGIGMLDKVVDVDQSPIGRTPRSNTATYTGLFTVLRDIFAALPEAKLRGYGPGRFSFNVRGGRCEGCAGDGIIKIEMQFLSDVYVPCEVCAGKRYNRETLEILYKGKNIAEVLEMTVEEALAFFSNIPSAVNRLKTLVDVGLDYIHLGQSATTLSGGEAQRIKLATELSKRATGKTIYILDEPTTGLHFADIDKLLTVLHRLVDGGNTVVVIEHNLDVAKTADWLIDLGPEGGDGGGKVVAQGTPEQVATTATHTGKFLKPLLRRK